MTREELAKEVSAFIMNTEDGLEVSDENEIELSDAASQISDFVEELQAEEDQDEG